MFKVHYANNLSGKITLQGQLLTIRDTNIQTCSQIFVKLMHYFTKFANFFINNCKFDIKLKLGLFPWRDFCYCFSYCFPTSIYYLTIIGRRKCLLKAILNFPLLAGSPDSIPGFFKTVLITG